MSTASQRRDAPELLVIGLGKSGAAALNAARAAGAHVTGLDCDSAPESGGLPGCHYCARVWGLFTDGSVACTNGDATRLYRPRAVIVATGATDIPLPVPGWHLSGSLGAHQALDSVDPGSEVTVLRGPHADTSACAPDLSRFDIVHDEMLEHGDPVEILGSDEVDSICIGDRTISTRHVLLDNGLQTENALARMAGIPSRFSASAGGDVIPPGSVFAVGGTLISVIGDAAGVGCEPEAMIREASETALLLTETLKGGDIPRSIPSARAPWDYDGAPRLPAQVTNDTLVCPDEGVTVGQVRDAIQRGATTVNDVKRRTHAAMAVCQGHDCLWTIRALLAEHGREFPTPMTARPPVVGIELGDLANLVPS